MRSQITSQNNRKKVEAGFLTMEIMLAFSLLILFIVSNITLTSSMQNLKVWSLLRLKELEKSVHDFDYFISNNFTDLSKVSVQKYGNDTQIFSLDSFAITHSDYENSWGSDSCSARINFNKNNIDYDATGIDMGTLNISSDIEVRNGFVYLTADSTSASLMDFYIINNSIISSLNTGPGVKALEMAGPYAFLAQSSTVNQLQILDIKDRTKPKLVAELKLPLPSPTTTPPFATSIFYRKGFIYLGTSKWRGSEFHIIDVSDVTVPRVVGSFETNTLVNDIYVVGDIAYLATSDEKQMRVVDISDKASPVLVDSFSPSGWQTQEGKILEYFEEVLAFGRTVGGFNVTANHEAFLISTTTTISKDIPGGVYGMILQPEYVFLLTHAIGKEFQVWKRDLSEKIYEMPLGILPTKMSCDKKTFYFSTGDNKGFSILKLNN